MKEWTTPDSRNTPSTTNLEEEEIVDVPGNDGNASKPEQVKRPNPWRKMMIMIFVTARNTMLSSDRCRAPILCFFQMHISTTNQ